MTSKERVLERERQRGYEAAEVVQAKSESMTGTELYAVEDRIPDFRAACKKQNMLNRKAGTTDGFVCRSTAGRVVRLIQNYDSKTFKQEPEELSAQWRFVWSTDPAKALPFISLATSPYAKGDCCLNEDGEPKRSKIDNNTWSPDTNPEFWEDGEVSAEEALSEIEEVLA